MRIRHNKMNKSIDIFHKKVYSIYRPHGGGVVIKGGVIMNTEQKKALQALKTCSGQIDGIIKMIEDGRYCIDISNQILAAEANIKRANKLILAQHISHCVSDAMEDEENKEVKLNEIKDIISKLLK